MLDYIWSIILITGAVLISLEVYTAVYQNIIYSKEFGKLITTIIGGIILILGAVLSLPLIPGPGLLLIILGLTILSREYPWAQKPLVWLKNKLSKRKKNNHNNINRLDRGKKD